MYLRASRGAKNRQSWIDEQKGEMGILFPFVCKYHPRKRGGGKLRSPVWFPMRQRFPSYSGQRGAGGEARYAFGLQIGLQTLQPEIDIADMPFDSSLEITLFPTYSIVDNLTVTLFRSSGRSSKKLPTPTENLSFFFQPSPCTSSTDRACSAFTLFSYLL
jgi:hypothetical protein